MSVKMKPTSEIKARIGINSGGRVQKYMTKRAADYMDKYVPFRDGILRTNVEIGDDYILYKSEYAHYQYKGILYVDPETGSSYARKDTEKEATSTPLNYHTAGTGSHWDKKMMTAERDKFIKEIEKYANSGGK